MLRMGREIMTRLFSSRGFSPVQAHFQIGFATPCGLLNPYIRRERLQLCLLGRLWCTECAVTAIVSPLECVWALLGMMKPSSLQMTSISPSSVLISVSTKIKSFTSNE